MRIARSGSGCVSAFLGSICGSSSACKSISRSHERLIAYFTTTIVYLCTDLNPHATRCTYQTGLANSVPLNPILTNLTSSLLPRLTRQVDVLVFNPPYVETEDEELYDAQEDGTIEKAWAGGESGMKITNKVLEQVDVTFLLSVTRQWRVQLTRSPIFTVTVVRTRALLPRRDSSKQTFRNP